MEGESSFLCTILHDQTVKLFNQGIYHFDKLFTTTGYKGQGAVALFLSVPLIVMTVFLYQRGKLNGHLFLVGTLGYFLYLYASMALGAAYKSFFFAYR